MNNSKTKIHNCVSKSLSRLNRLIVTVLSTFLVQPSYSDTFYNDDVIVKGSLCVGVDCANGENFNFDTIRLRENNVRIKFDDTSSSSSFPNFDWQLTANDSGNGGLNHFSIEDITSSSVPFRVEGGSRDYSIFVSKNRRVGFNTNAPAVELHTLSGNSPALRLDQDGSSGFTSQAWDLGGNETNFFIRDVTNAASLPFRIQAGASKNSIFIASDGDVGFETQSPDGLFDIAHPSDANNHAVLVSPVGNFGINIDNSFVPAGLLDVQTTGGKSRFTVTSDGKVGVGLANPSGPFQIQSADGTTPYMFVNNSGQIGYGTTTINQYGIIVPKVMYQGPSNEHTGMGIDTPTGASSTSLVFGKEGVFNWFVNSTNDFTFPSGVPTDRLVFYNNAATPVLVLQRDGNIGFGVTSNITNAIQHSNGAHLTTGGVWTNASSRELKNNIIELTKDVAFSALNSLNPVTYNYKVSPDESHVGFIAEDVPELVATNDRKGLASMDIVAVLTKVAKEQQAIIESLNERLKILEQQAKESK